MKILLTLYFAATAAVVLCAADAPKESDSRLQSNGKGWRLDQAAPTDAKLPRALLVGDSILNGYQADVITALKGRVSIDAWVNPYHQSENVNRLLADVLAHGPYDVVHFNMGLHGWQKGRIAPEAFQPLTRAYVEVIRQKLPKAKIIWASSTPVTVKGMPGQLDSEINPIIVEHNRLAADVMKSMNVPVNDLYALMVPRLSWAAGDQFHWKKEAYQVMSKAVAEEIIHALGQ